MTREEYQAWTGGTARRYEREHGVAVSMPPERSERALANGNVWNALRQAIQGPTRLEPPGITIQLDDIYAA